MKRGPVIFVTDPPWENDDAWGAKGAAAKYQCIPTEAIMRFALPLPVVRAEVSVCFLWAISSMLPDALRVMKAYDYRYHSMMMWEKLTKSGRPSFGGGRIVRGSHEPCLIGVRGEGYFPIDKAVRSRFAAKVGEHSEKPDEFFALLERMYPNSRRYEQFARKVRPGWIQQGDQLGKLGTGSVSHGQKTEE